MRTRTQDSRHPLPTRLLGAAIAAVLHGAPVVAQQEAATSGIEEVVVTAQRRAENLQDVPIAVTSFAGRDLDTMRVQTIEDLALKTPNFTLVPQASGNTTYGVAMRGVALTDSVITADSPVGIYIDGVVVSKMAGAVFDFLDLERVEVLRGPQGTLYGRNTPAGAINLVTRKPSGEFGGEATVGFGNYNLREIRASLDTGTADLGGAGRLSARISGRFSERDGWAKDIVTGRDLDSRHRVGGRLSLRWQPSDAVTVDYAFDTMHIDEDPPAAQLTEDATGFLGGFVSRKREDTFALSYGIVPGPGELGIGRTKTRLDIDTHTLTAEWRLSDRLALKSISGYRTLEDEEPTDFDGTPIAWADFNVFNKLDTFSQELQLLGNTADNGLTYVTGLYFYNEKASVRAPGVFGFGTVGQEPRFRTDNDAYAIFGQVDWRPAAFDRRLTLTAGARYTKESREMTDHHVFVTFAGDPTVVDLTNVARVSKDFSNFSPAATIAWAFTPDVNVYFRYAEGWRSGGFNGRSSTPEQVANAFDPESLKSYEIGFKGMFWDRRLQFNAAAFLSDYTDLQSVITGPASTGVGFTTLNDNVGKIEITGLELESRVALTDRLLISLTYSFLNTDVKKYELCFPVDGGEGGQICDFQNVGNERVIPLISKRSGTLALDYRPLETEQGTLRLHVDADYRSKAIGGGQTLRVPPRESAPGYIRSYTLVNGRVSWENMPIGGGHLDLGIWGRNLTDRDTAQFALNLLDALGIGVTRFLTPRTYGVDATFRF